MSPEHIVDLTKTMLEQMSRSEERRYLLEIDRSKKQETNMMAGAFFGTILACLGYGIAAYLALNGQKDVALSISTPLTALIAVVLGRKLTS